MLIVPVQSDHDFVHLAVLESLVQMADQRAADAAVAMVDIDRQAVVIPFVIVHRADNHTDNLLINLSY